MCKGQGFVNRIIGLSVVLSMIFSNIVPGFAASGESGVPYLLTGVQLGRDKVEFLWEGGRDVNVEQIRKAISLYYSALAIPEKNWWVDLFLWNTDREVLGNGLERTELGKILVESDLKLKQLVQRVLGSDRASLFWDTVESLRYETVSPRFWIEPGKVNGIRDNDTFRIYDAKLCLRVAIEDSKISKDNKQRLKQILMTSVVPIIEHQLNFGEQFSELRAAYYAMLLAAWTKENREISASLSNIKDSYILPDLERINVNTYSYLVKFCRMILSNQSNLSIVDLFGGGGEYQGVSVAVKRDVEKVQEVQLKDKKKGNEHLAITKIPEIKMLDWKIVSPEESESIRPDIKKNMRRLQDLEYSSSSSLKSSSLKREKEDVAYKMPYPLYKLASFHHDWGQFSEREKDRMYADAKILADWILENISLALEGKTSLYDAGKKVTKVLEMNKRWINGKYVEVNGTVIEIVDARIAEWLQTKSLSDVRRNWLSSIRSKLLRYVEEHYELYFNKYTPIDNSLPISKQLEIGKVNLIRMMRDTSLVAFADVLKKYKISVSGENILEDIFQSLYVALEKSLPKEGKVFLEKVSSIDSSSSVKDILTKLERRDLSIEVKHDLSVLIRIKDMLILQRIIDGLFRQLLKEIQDGTVNPNAKNVRIFYYPMRGNPWHMDHIMAILKVLTTGKVDKVEPIVSSDVRLPNFNLGILYGPMIELLTKYVFGDLIDFSHAKLEVGKVGKQEKNAGEKIKSTMASAFDEENLSEVIRETFSEVGISKDVQQILTNKKQDISLVAQMPIVMAKLAELEEKLRQLEKEQFFMSDDLRTLIRRVRHLLGVSSHHDVEANSTKPGGLLLSQIDILVS